MGFTALSCDPLDTKIDTAFTEDQLASDYSKLDDLGYAAYSYLRSGFYFIDGNIDAAMSDEAAYTQTASNVRLFNEGSWNQYSNPDDVYLTCYKGIRAANFFLDYSTDYKNILAINRDTLSDNGYQYRLSVQDVEWLRAENKVLRAYFYFELMKRYGDVPLIKEVLPIEANTARTSFDEVVDYAVSVIDNALDELQVNWKALDAQRDGRLTKGAAMALKSRILLYAASPLHNPSNSISAWEKAAQAAYDVIELNQYKLGNNYSNLFLESNSTQNDEIILSFRDGATNSPEKANYPIATPGGNSGITPSQNIVDSYEYKGTPDAANPYLNRDPRLGYSIVVNNSQWNDRTLQIYEGGTDDPAQTNASRTGYYLKKFLLPNLYLVQDEKRIHNWVMFRYAEILLNYAEAMNEAYGPNNNNGNSLTALEALNLVRSRPSVEMPAIDTSDNLILREKIKHERRVELAFEGHRYWDLRRWKDAETVLNEPIRGAKITKTSENSFSYQYFVVEQRKFDAAKMYFYPIPYVEIAKSNNILTQNPNW